MEAPPDVAAHTCAHCFGAPVGAVHGSGMRGAGLVVRGEVAEVLIPLGVGELRQVRSQAAST